MIMIRIPMFYGETNDLVHAHSNILNFHVLLIFGNVVGNTRQVAMIGTRQDNTVKKHCRVLDKGISFSRRRPYLVRFQAKGFADKTQRGGNLVHP